MYGYGYRYNSGLVLGAGGGAPFANTYSLSFDGVDDFVIAPLDGTTTGGILPSNSSDIDLTISIWFNKTTNTSMFQWADRLTSGIPFILIAGTASGYRILINNAYQFDAVISSGTWVNVVIVRNSATNVWTHYLNGVAIQTYNDGGTLARRLNATDIYLGNGYSSYFNGLIDEVSIWNTDQSANIATLSASPTEDLTSLSPTVWLRNGDNGAYKSPQWLIPSNENKDKVSNYSFELDGVDDYISVSDNSIGQTQNISYSIWLNLDVTTDQWIIGNQSSSNGGAGLAIKAGALIFQMADGGNDSYFNSRVASFSTYAPINNWNHILATWDGTDSKIYINGVLRNTWSPTLPYTISGYDTTFNIGWRAAGFTQMTNGKLDELALFDSGVSIADVWDGSGEPIDVSAVSGITNNWRMGEEATFSGGVWTVPDAVGSNDGTSNAMTIEDRVGNAPNSDNNALSYNMDEVDRVTDVP